MAESCTDWHHRLNLSMEDHNSFKADSAAMADPVPVPNRVQGGSITVASSGAFAMING
jgi:hypothetical protein